GFPLCDNSIAAAVATTKGDRRSDDVNGGWSRSVLVGSFSTKSSPTSFQRFRIQRDFGDISDSW
ncbi:hypothetical protein TIFTF001_056702, partial [Ficus carica]